MKNTDFYIIIVAGMKIRFFDHDDTKEFNSVYQRLMPDFNGYELFDAPPAFAAYEDGVPAALATLLILPKNAAIPGSGDDSSLEAELTLFVHPKYRKRGLAKELARNIKEYMDENFPGVLVVYTLPKALFDSSFARYPAFSEILMQITPGDSCKITPIERITERLSEEGLEIVTTRQEDDICLKLMTAKIPGHTEISSVSCQSPDTETSPGLPLIAEVHFIRDENIACLHGLYVLPEFRGRGLGQMLAEYGVSYFLNDDIPVILNVRDTNSPALNLYKKIGFTEADSCKYYKLPLTHL